MKVSVLLVPCLLLFLAPQTTEAYAQLASKITDEICDEMFPVGHDVDAMKSDVPFELVVSKTRYDVNDNVTVTLKMKDPNPTKYKDFEGLFVQARKATCETKPVGTFNLTEGMDFLQVVDCPERPKSAVAHKKKEGVTSVSFQWTAPATQAGTVYFRATVVHEKEEFWTNVFSEYLEEEVPAEYCEVRTTSIASSISAAASLVLAAAVLGRLL